MAKKKRRSSGKKRTITPEQQAKMQAARKNKKIHQERMSQLSEAGLNVREDVSRTQQMLNSVRRKG